MSYEHSKAQETNLLSIEAYTDGLPKMTSRVDCDTFINGLDTKLSYRLVTAEFSNQSSWYFKCNTMISHG